MNTKGLLHCHSENSRYDSPLNVTDLVLRAKELGYNAVTLTDHGTLTGIDDFVAAAKAEGIKPIPGVELYMLEDDSLSKRLHLILIAKDDLGYQGISKVVSLSNKRIFNGYPCTNKKLLEDHFAEGKAYHGHVIATTACINGIVGGLSLEQNAYKQQITKLSETLKSMPSDTSDIYLRNKKKIEASKAELEEMKLERDELAKLAKKPFKKKENALAKLKDSPEYDEALKLLNQEKAESLRAAEKLNEIKLKIAVMSKRISDINSKIKEDEKKFPKSDAVKKKIKAYEALIKDPDSLEKLMTNEFLYYRDLFGRDDFYAELQYHGYEDCGFPTELLIMRFIAGIAKHYNVPVCAANDVHIKDNKKETIRARYILNSIRFGKDQILETKKGDDQLYIKSEDELKQALLMVVDEETADKAIQNTYEMLDRCNCEFKSGSHYPKFPLPNGESAPDALRRFAYEGIKKRFPNPDDWTGIYQERLEYELSVISGMGFADYFLIVKDFLEFGRKLGHLNDEAIEYLRENIKTLSLDELITYVDTQPKVPGFAIGAGRGSAAGSLVAYLVGITNIIDPLKYDLLFEREKIALYKFG